MTNKEYITRNIGLTFDFVRYLIDNPKMIEKIPDEFILEFVEKDFSKKNQRSPKVFKKQKETFVRVRNTFEISGIK
jgi:hypothetical protein